MTIIEQHLTGAEEIESIEKGFKSGGCDYITKPYFPAELVARVNTHIKLRHATREIQDGISCAQKIQETIFPNENEFINTFQDCFILIKPKDKLSGDFYWIKEILSENKVCFAIVDCVGHGLSGALLSMLGYAFLNDIVKEKITSTNNILDELQKRIVDALQQKNNVEANQVGMDIALCIYDTSTKILEYAGAHNPIYIIRKLPCELIVNNAINSSSEESSDYALFEIKGDKQSIGYHPVMSFTNNIIQLKKEDAIYLKSDGYSDQSGGPKDRKFMVKQFKELLVNNAGKPLHEEKDILKQSFENWKGTNDQTDDITVLGIKL